MRALPSSSIVTRFNASTYAGIAAQTQRRRESAAVPLSPASRRSRALTLEDASKGVDPIGENACGPSNSSVVPSRTNTTRGVIQRMGVTVAVIVASEGPGKPGSSVGYGRGNSFSMTGHFLDVGLPVCNDSDRRRPCRVTIGFETDHVIRRPGLSKQGSDADLLAIDEHTCAARRRSRFAARPRTGRSYPSHAALGRRQAASAPAWGEPPPVAAWRAGVGAAWGRTASGDGVGEPGVPASAWGERPPAPAGGSC